MLVYLNVQIVEYHSYTLKYWRDDLLYFCFRLFKLYYTCTLTSILLMYIGTHTSMYVCMYLDDKWSILALFLCNLDLLKVIHYFGQQM